MANRVVEVYYQLKDLFTGQVKKISAGYSNLRKSSKETADQIVRDNKRSTSSISKLGQSVGKLRTLWYSLGAAVAAFKVNQTFFRFVDEADRLGKVSAKLGIAVDELTALTYAAERSGVSVQQFEIALQRLQRKTGDAVNGMGEAQQAFANFGIDAEKFADLNIEEKILELATAFNAVGQEEQALSSLVKLVDSEGAGIAVLLQEGPSGIKKLVSEYKKLNPEIEKASKEAEKFNDSLAKLSATSEGLARQGLTPVVGYLNKAAAEFGLSAEEADNLSVQLELAEARLQGLSKYANRNSVAFKQTEKRVKELREALADLEKQTEENTKADEKLVKEKAAQIAANTAYTKSIEDINDRFKSLSDARIAQIEKEARDVEKARKDQLRIEQEFQDRLEDITGKDLKPEDVSLGDVSLQQRRAAAAAERGESEEAVKLAREGFDLLDLLKEKGSETSGTLKSLAEQLKKVAVEASAENVKKEDTELDKAKAAFAGLQKQADFLKANAPKAGSEYAQLFLEGARQELANTVLPAPTIARPSLAAPRIVNGVATDGTDYGQEVNKRGGK